jgi:hypothetical protein
MFGQYYTLVEVFVYNDWINFWLTVKRGYQVEMDLEAITIKNWEDNKIKAHYTSNMHAC